MQLTTILFTMFAATAMANLHADDAFVQRRADISEAHLNYLDARQEYNSLVRRMGGNGECAGKSSSGKNHCMKGGRSCASKGCAAETAKGTSCLCDAGFTG